jgi:tRNA A-37 threonylcarbamoyl transferase component Bud32
MTDFCTTVAAIKHPRNVRALFPLAAKQPGRSPSYRVGEDVVRLGKLIGEGASGRVYRCVYRRRSVVVKLNVNPSQREDMHEALMQARLYCHLRDTGQTGAHLAHVPEAFFAATLPDLGRVLGMQRVDVPLLRFAGEQRSIQPLRDVLHKVCELLVVLQRDLAFMHGDLHGENVMLVGKEVFLIDFGMSSARFGSQRRMTTDVRYDGVRFHPQLDLLTLLTSLREDLAEARRPALASWCGAFVDPFWKVVRDGIVYHRPSRKYGAHQTVRVGLDTLAKDDEIYYAHHLLYEEIGRVNYPDCDPRRMRTLLARVPTSLGTVAPLASTFFFEGVVV